jgi:hypothetical protein
MINKDAQQPSSELLKMKSNEPSIEFDIISSGSSNENPYWSQAKLEVYFERKALKFNEADFCWTVPCMAKNNAKGEYWTYYWYLSISRVFNT